MEIFEVLKQFVSIPLGISVVFSIEFIKKQPKGWLKNHPNLASIIATIFFTVAVCIAGGIQWKESLLQAGLVYLVANIFYDQVIRRIKKLSGVKDTAIQNEVKKDGQ